MISARPLLGLARYFLALLLLAGAPVAADERPYELALSQLRDSPPSQALGRDDRGRTREIAAAAACADIEDEPEPLALLLTEIAIAPVPVAVVEAGRAGGRAAPLSHWPCASPPTGPPKAK